ncbi:MAG: vancomycin high temperature exclusion protein [Sphingobacteriales bacterium]|nr:MAG: vancomycin high temperature exclusion protein [Sphingobacteriales bacterium]
MRKRSLFIIIVVLIVALPILSVLYCDSRVEAISKGKTFYDTESVPYNKVGLLLGTGKYLESGYLNRYYTYRIEAATKLMKAGKIKYLVISGDNSRKDYNEPEMMRTDLIAAGIDSSHIYLDYAGFRTFDSMIRLREIFSQNSATVISQRFHNERALYIAQREGINAVGYNADDVIGNAGQKTQFREKLARVKVFVDYLLGVEPKFLGPKVRIG